MKAIQLFSLLIFSSCILLSCKINQRKNGLKTGKWVYKDTFMNVISESRGRYKKDFEVGTWKDYISETLITKRKYKDNICHTTHYHKNGQIRAIGISKMIIDSTNLHWFLSGEWKFYDSEGVLLGTKIYEKDNPITETYFIED